MCERSSLREGMNKGLEVVPVHLNCYIMMTLMLSGLGLYGEVQLEMEPSEAESNGEAARSEPSVF